MSNTELAVSLAAVAALLLAGAVAFITSLSRRPRKADRAYHASLREVAASYSDDGVYADVPFVPARPFADEGGQR